MNKSERAYVNDLRRTITALRKANARLIRDQKRDLEAVRRARYREEDRMTERQFRSIVKKAIKGLDAGMFVAAYRGWWGYGGPGLFTRLQLADDIKALIEHARSKAK